MIPIDNTVPLMNGATVAFAFETTTVAFAFETTTPVFSHTGLRSVPS